ncbi:hypothetical protein H920_11536 [Fukomys damarensis]|uniref:Uncharacterized protein n=1 Tax=Fukomys damarensis TaxID=885580 RepID=A0A091DA53_FUKDA|nr:hypothetical protein H920_11536 [Fukomys damarensis]
MDTDEPQAQQESAAEEQLTTEERSLLSPALLQRQVCAPDKSTHIRSPIFVDFILSPPQSPSVCLNCGSLQVQAAAHVRPQGAQS